MRSNLRLSVPVLVLAAISAAALIGFHFRGPAAAVLPESSVDAAPPAEGLEAVLAQGPSARPSADELRRKYPFVSLRERLQFESERADGRQRLRPILSEQARGRLDRIDASMDTDESRVRTRSLAMLHSNRVQEFIESEGFGMSRMPVMKPSPDYLDYAESPPVPLAERKTGSAEVEAGSTLALPVSGVLEQPGGAWAPSLALLDDFHRQDQMNFAGPWSFGWVKDREHVAGFVSHGFAYLPELGHPDNRTVPAPDGRSPPVETRPAKWTVARLELVSLLKFDEPAVYVSEHLPQMKELAQAQTRPLTEFERRGLESLAGGEDIVTSGQTNEIRMLGSLRAARQCLECHSAERGELLGAFSYVLQRVPPLPVKSSAGKPAA